MSSRSKHIRIVVFFLIAVCLIVIDRLSKAWAADTLHQGVVGLRMGPIALTLVHNRGAAFGMGQGSGLLFVGIAAGIVVAILVWLFVTKECSAWELVGMALVFSGGIGNAIDRLTTGYVVDFIEFTFVDFPVFNVADMCVTCGVVMVLVAMIGRFRQADLEVRAEKAAADAAAREAAADGDSGSGRPLGSGQEGAAAGQASAEAQVELQAEPEEELSPEDEEWERDVAAYEAEYENAGENPAREAGGQEHRQERHRAD